MSAIQVLQISHVKYLEATGLNPSGRCVGFFIFKQCILDTLKDEIVRFPKLLFFPEIKIT